MHCRHVYEISAESNCRIQMPDQIISTAPLAVTLEGTLESAVKCMDLFLSKKPAVAYTINGGLGSGISPSAAGVAILGPKSSSPRGPPAQQSRPSTAAGAAAVAGLGIRADDGSFLSLDQHSPFSFSSFGLGAGGSVPGGELTYGQHANANMLSMGLLGGGQGVPGISSLATDHDLDGRDDGGLGLGRQQLGQSVGGLEYSLSFPLPSSGSGGSLHGMGGMMGGGDMGSNGLGSSAQLHMAKQQQQQQRQNQNGQAQAQAQAQAQQAQPPVVHAPRETFRERVRVTLAQLPRMDEQYTVNSVPAGSSSPPLSPGTAAGGADSGTKLVQLIPFLLKLFAVANLRITPSLPQVRKALTQPQGQGQGGRGGAANVSGGNGKSAAAAAAAEGEGANSGRRRRASDNDDEDEDDDDTLEGSDEGSDEDSEEGSEVDEVAAPSTAMASTTMTIFASSAVEAKLCAATLRAVLEGRSLQAALDVLPSRKDMRAMVVAEREAAAATAAAGGGGKNGEGRGRGGGGAAGAGSGRSGARPRGGRREKEKAARRAAAQAAAAAAGGGAASGGSKPTSGSSKR